MYVEPKNVWFLLSRHDIRKVHEKLFSRRYERAVGCFTHFGFLSPKTFDSYFTDIMYVEFMRYFFLPIRANWWVLDSFSPLEPKNVWFLLSRHDVRQVHQKFSSRRYRASYLLFDSFRPPEPKNVWFLLSRHDIRKVHGKLFSRRYERAVGCFTHFGFLSPKTFDSYFTDIMYVEFMRNFFLADSSKLMGVRLIFASWAQKRLIPTF